MEGDSQLVESLLPLGSYGNDNRRIGVDWRLFRAVPSAGAAWWHWGTDSSIVHRRDERCRSPFQKIGATLQSLVTPIRFCVAVERTSSSSSVGKLWDWYG